MNLYDLHSNPEQLHGFDIAPYKIPAFAYDLARKNPELRPKFEPVIAKDPEYAYYYAYYILKRRWPEAEPYIMKDPKYAYLYAHLLVNGRWPEAERYIMKNQKYWDGYKESFNL